jgi:nucleotide-binding universal stress UspA family protein
MGRPQDLGEQPTSGANTIGSEPLPSLGIDCPGLAIRHILVPLDGSPLSERAVPHAAAIAQALDARITLLRVLRAPRGDIDPLEWEFLRAEAHSHLTRLEVELTGRRVTSTIEVLEGRPAEQIIHYAESHEVDLVVLSSHGEGGLTAWVLSSTAQKVVARAHSSIFIIPAYDGEVEPSGVQFRRILVPLDCSPRAECVLPFATALARAHGGELILVHVVPQPEIPRRMSPSPEDLRLAEQLTDRNRAESGRYLSALSSNLSAQDLRVRTVTAVSARRPHAILQLADDEGIDLIVMCAHGATGDASERYGSVAARIIQGSCRPLIVLQDLTGTLHETTRVADAAREHSGH